MVPQNGSKRNKRDPYVIRGAGVDLRTPPPPRRLLRELRANLMAPERHIELSAQPEAVEMQSEAEAPQPRFWRRKRRALLEVEEPPPAPPAPSEPSEAAALALLERRLRHYERRDLVWALFALAKESDV